MRRSPVALLFVAAIAAAAAPPTTSKVVDALRVLQRAATSDDRPAFTAALAEMRSALASDPHAAQSNADAMQIYTDIDRFWTWGESSPTGAFYDASSDDGKLMTIAKKYAGLTHAVAAATIVAGGRTMYPTRETRLYLASVAGQQGMRRSAAPGTVTVPRKHLTPTPNAAPPPTHRREKKDPPAQPKPAPSPAASTAPATTTTSSPAPVATTTTAAPPPAPATTMTTATTATTASEPPPAPKDEPASINMIVAIILVIVGVGLAVVLFRASD